MFIGIISGVIVGRQNMKRAERKTRQASKYDAFKLGHQSFKMKPTEIHMSTRAVQQSRKLMNAAFYSREYFEM